MTSPGSVRALKCVLVGDGNVGKTALMNVYLNKKFQGHYDPTIAGNETVTLEVDRRHVKLDIWDTGGQEAFEGIRVLSYDSTDIFMLCFSVERRISLTNATTVWLEEILKYRPNATIILVANKIDLRNNPINLADLSIQQKAPVTQAEGVNLVFSLRSKVVRLVKYVETSARDGTGVHEAFQEAVRGHFELEAMQAGKRRNSRPIKEDKRNKEEGKKTNCGIL